MATYVPFIDFYSFFDTDFAQVFGLSDKRIKEKWAKYLAKPKALVKFVPTEIGSRPGSGLYLVIFDNPGWTK